MKLDILGVQAFVALAEHGSFVKAAKALFITQAALSRRLQNLEAFLGVRLVERTTRSRALTQVGEEFLPQVRRLLADLGASLHEVRERGRSLRGDVTVACVPTVGIQYLPGVIQAYAQRHPDNRIRILDHASAGVERAVLQREAEFGIGIALADHGGLHSVPLLRDRFVLLCRADHPLAGRRRVRWAQLAGHDVILPGTGSSNRPLLDAMLGEAGLPQSGRFEVQRSSTAVGLVAAGVAAAVVPSLALQAGTYPSLRAVALTEPEVARTFVLLSRRGVALSPAAQALYDLCLGAQRPREARPGR
jgi:DNA-binding transcriptional LysR family regulator